eukprot:10622-Heterococcus_DN1.PRE.3
MHFGRIDAFALVTYDASALLTLEYCALWPCIRVCTTQCSLVSAMIAYAYTAAAGDAAVDQGFNTAEPSLIHIQGEKQCVDLAVQMINKKLSDLRGQRALKAALHLSAYLPSAVLAAVSSPTSSTSTATTTTSTSTATSAADTAASTTATVPATTVSMTVTIAATATTEAKMPSLTGPTPAEASKTKRVVSKKGAGKKSTAKTSTATATATSTTAQDVATVTTPVSTPMKKSKTPPTAPSTVEQQQQQQQLIPQQQLDTVPYKLDGSKGADKTSATEPKPPAILESTTATPAATAATAIVQRAMSPAAQSDDYTIEGVDTENLPLTVEAVESGYTNGAVTAAHEQEVSRKDEI